jgi:hypothetical protein
MASGILLQNGQVFILDAIKNYIATVTSGVYVGLLTNTTRPAETYQLPTASGITEVSGVGYARQLCTTWLVNSGVSPYIQGDNVVFNASGTWSSVNGYFVSTTISGNDALWTELYPLNLAGPKTSGDILNITPKYFQDSDI